MMKRNMLILTMVIAVLLISSAIYAKSMIPSDIFTQFTNLEKEINHHEDLILVEGEHFQINTSRFIFYKSNIKMLYDLNHLGEIPSDEELMHNLIETELFSLEAMREGLAVTEQEITDEISFQRTALNDPNATGQEAELVKDILKARIDMTGLSDEEFWNSHEVREVYRKSILRGKLHTLLFTEGSFKKPEDFEKYKDGLFAKYSSTYTIHWGNVP